MGCTCSYFINLLSQKLRKKLKELNCEVAILDRMFLSNTYTKPLSVKFENPAVTKKIFHGLLTHAFLE